jgi:hypothetical protein
MNQFLVCIAERDLDGKAGGEAAGGLVHSQARWLYSCAILKSLQTWDADQVRLDRAMLWRGFSTEMGKSKSILNCHSLFHVRNRSIDELLFDAQIAETRPQKADAL